VGEGVLDLHPIPPSTGLNRFAKVSVFLFLWAHYFFAFFFLFFFFHPNNTELIA